MPNDKKTEAKPESQRQAEWIRSHPTADDSSPDEAKRQGASRGALPIGNPWGAKTPPDDFCERATLPDSQVVQAPPYSPVPVVIQGVVTGVDKGLAERVGERLSESKAFDDHHIELRVTDGEVELGGIVASQADRLEAGHLASSVRGVVRVVNQLRVLTAAR